MSENAPIRDLINKWPTRKALAEQVGANIDAVHKWAASNRIPSDWQASVVSAAQANGLHDVTAEWMLSQHSRLAV